jgi:hypothetical protein
MKRIVYSLVGCTFGLALATSAQAHFITCDFSRGQDTIAFSADGDLQKGTLEVRKAWFKGEELKDVTQLELKRPQVYKTNVQGDGKVESKILTITYSADLNLETQQTLIGHYPPPGGPTNFVKGLTGICYEQQVLMERDPSLPIRMHGLPNFGGPGQK